jgi:hypothetical protein
MSRRGGAVNSGSNMLISLESCTRDSGFTSRAQTGPLRDAQFLH